MMAINRIKSLRHCEDGTSVTEFGLIAIPLFMMTMGTMDVGYTYYVKAILAGELNKLSRSSSLEGASTVTQQAILDQRLKKAIKVIAPQADVNVDRRYYKTFSDAASAEAEELISDVNNNGVCNTGDTYVDENNNDGWDADGGNDGQGGARDVVIIKVNVTYERFFPIHKMVLGLSDNMVLVSDSVLANQPFGTQSQYGAAVTKTC
jgi:hypothetical protein